jgi:hypothetical protein
VGMGCGVVRGETPSSSTLPYVCMCVCVRARERACVRACVRACCVCVCARARVLPSVCGAGSECVEHTHTHTHAHTHTQVRSAWSKHKDIAVIVNGSGGFEGKIMDVRAAMAKFLQIKGWSVAEQVTTHFTAHFTAYVTAYVPAHFTTHFTTCCVSAKFLEIKGWGVAEQISRAEQAGNNGRDYQAWPKSS